MNRNSEFLRLICAGLIWGFAELTLGSLLHAIHSPYKGMVMTGIGLSTIGLYLLRTRKVWHPLLIGLIAGGVKCCGSLFLGIPFWSRAIINPVAAIISEAAAVTIIIGLSTMLVNCLNLNPASLFLNIFNWLLAGCKLKKSAAKKIE